MYSRDVEGKTLSFGHEGTLYRKSFVMYDKQTNSLWVHTTGEAIKGPLKGKRLAFVPSVVMTWKQWKTRHPNTTVLTGKRGSAFMGRFGLAADMSRYGVSVGQGKTPKLYPYSLLAEQRIINDTHKGQPLVVYFDATARAAFAYVRPKGTTFRWQEGQVLDDKARVWDLSRGVLRKSSLILAALPATPWLIKRWRGFYLDGITYAK